VPTKLPHWKFCDGGDLSGTFSPPPPRLSSNVLWVTEVISLSLVAEATEIVLPPSGIPWSQRGDVGFEEENRLFLSSPRRSVEGGEEALILFFCPLFDDEGVPPPPPFRSCEGDD